MGNSRSHSRGGGARPRENCRMRIMRLASVLAIAVQSSCLPGPAEPPGKLSPGGIHVLFIGNSLTYANDLPGALVSLGQFGGDTIRCSSVAGPDLALIDHYNGATPAR